MVIARPIDLNVSCKLHPYPLCVYVWGFIGKHYLWLHPCFYSSAQHVFISFYLNGEGDWRLVTIQLWENYMLEIFALSFLCTWNQISFSNLLTEVLPQVFFCTYAFNDLMNSQNLRYCWLISLKSSWFFLRTFSTSNTIVL